MDIKITSSAFQNGGMIPIDYTCTGKNISPPLQWSGVPNNTKTLALICDDPDAPVGTWVHWVLFNLPVNTTALSENISREKILPDGSIHGINDFRKIGYDGPCPPSGTHRYFFKMYALDIEVKLTSGATKEDLLNAMRGHVLAQGELIGKYIR